MALSTLVSYAAGLGFLRWHGAARGVLAVNVTEALRVQAADDLARNEYVYFLDDTHWSDRGIAAAARTLVDACKEGSRLAGAQGVGGGEALQRK